MNLRVLDRENVFQKYRGVTNKMIACTEKMKMTVVSRVTSTVKKNLYLNYFIQNIVSVALTDGKTILIDSDLRPKLRHAGIVCANKNSEWSVECVRRGDPQKNKELASQVCFSLGFTGYTFFNVSRVDENGLIQTRGHQSPERNVPLAAAYMPNARSSFIVQSGLHHLVTRDVDVELRDSKHHKQSHEIVVGAPPKQCFALYLECVPHSIIPIIDIKPTETSPKPIDSDVTERPKPNETSPKPKPTSEITPTKEPPSPSHFEPISPVEIDPVQHENDTTPEIIKDNFSAPWTASVYINGHLTCIGILFDRQWILVDNICVKTVE